MKMPVISSGEAIVLQPVTTPQAITGKFFICIRVLLITIELHDHS